MIKLIKAMNFKENCMELIKACLKDEDLLTSIRQAPSDPTLFTCWWLGQSGFLIKWNGRHLLLDPYLSDSLTKKYAATDKPHIRMSELVIDPARLDFIDIVSSSHNHTDHLDAETLLPLMQANPALKMVIPEANRAFVASRLQCDPAWPIGLDAGQSIEIQGFTFTAVPAAHEHVDRDEAGRCHYLGYTVQFGSFAIYHSGDTVRYDGMEDLLRPFGVDLAFLPINGRTPERRVAGNLNASEAARLGKDIGAKLVVPCHYDMFTFNTADPADFEKAAKKLGLNFRILAVGESFQYRELKA
jgi:L-ascorbate metabolism protein UlaG (beta-lactamase superfamily)